MNSKISTMVFVLPIILVVLIGIIAAAIILGDPAIKVTSVKITNEEFDNTDRTYVVNVDDKNTLQLTWEVLPEDADDKSVSFTSTNEAITVNNEGLVTFNEPFVGAGIQIKTTDGGHTDTVYINTTSLTTQEVNYDFDSNTISASANNSYSVYEGKLVIYLGTTYSLGENIDVSCESTNVSINAQEGFTITPNAVGEIQLTLTNEGQNKTLDVIVAERINSIILPNELIALTDNQGNQVTSINIGNQNAYHFNYTIPSVTNGEVAVSLQEKVDGSFEDVEDVNALLTYNLEEKSFTFTNSAVGKTYKLIISSKYNSAVSVAYELNVNNGYNISSDAEMKTYFNDNSKTNLYLVNNIVAQAPQDLMNGQYLVREATRGIYARTASVNFNGNYFKIDASSVPLMEQKRESTGELSFVHNNTSLFALGDLVNAVENKYRKDSLEDALSKDTATAEQKLEQQEYVLGLYATAPEMNFKNLSIVGNVGKAFNITNENGEKEYGGFAGLNGLTVDGVKLSFENFNESNFTVGYKTKYGTYGLSIKNCYFGDNAGYNVYIRRTYNVVLQDSTFGECGHAAVYVKSDDSDKLIDSYTPIANLNVGSADTNDVNNTLYNDGKQHSGNYVQLIGDIVFDNWTSGNDPFISFTAEKQLPITIKTLISKLMGLHTSGLSLILRNYEDLDNAEFNWGLMAESISGEVSYSEFDTTQLTGYKESFNMNAYWQALALATEGQNTGNQTLMTQAAQLIQNKIWANDSIACVSINAGLAGLGGSYPNAMTYLFVGYLQASN